MLPRLSRLARRVRLCRHLWTADRVRMGHQLVRLFYSSRLARRATHFQWCQPPFVVGGGGRVALVTREGRIGPWPLWSVLDRGRVLAATLHYQAVVVACALLVGISAGNALLHNAGVPYTWVLPAAGGFALGLKICPWLQQRWLLRACAVFGAAPLARCCSNLVSFSCR